MIINYNIIKSNSGDKMKEENLKTGNFLRVSTCPECGAPIWIDQVTKLINTLPKTYYSCNCHETKQQKIKEIENELKTLKNELRMYKKTTNDEEVVTAKETKEKPSGQTKKFY
jgi:uncharacterized Zn finger protein (UPF0148 family)